MTTEKKVARRKLTLLELAGPLGNVSTSRGSRRLSVTHNFHSDHCAQGDVSEP
jgi:hypothetical protein